MPGLERLARRLEPNALAGSDDQYAGHAGAPWRDGRHHSDGPPQYRCASTKSEQEAVDAVMIVPDRGGNGIRAVSRSEAEAAAFIARRVRKGTVVNADEASSWNDLQSRFEMKRINHEQAYSYDGACTNWAEEFFSRMRRAEIGHHHHIAGNYLLRYAQESSWREDNRRQSNGEQVNRLSGLALKAKPSVDFSGYWQRHTAA